MDERFACHAIMASRLRAQDLYDLAPVTRGPTGGRALNMLSVPRIVLRRHSDTTRPYERKRWVGDACAARFV